MADHALVERARNGDHDAFTALAGTRVDQLHAIATLILRDRSAAEDAVQEALVRAWVGLPKLRQIDRFDAWLHRLLVHACTDSWRMRRRRAEIQLLPTHDRAISDPTAGVAEREAISRAFRHLSIDHRVVLVLRHFMGLPVPAVAAAVEIPLGTAKSRLHHAERALRTAIEADARTPAIRPGSRWA